LIALVVLVVLSIGVWSNSLLHRQIQRGRRLALSFGHETFQFG
jgi:hypothetical protein